MIDNVIWLEEIVEKLSWKHRVTPAEVEEVFQSKYRVWRAENGYVEKEDVYNVLGRTQQGRYLSVFYIRKKLKTALIISARDMSKKEKRKYAKK